MNKIILALLVCILVAIGIGDYFLVKIDRDVNYTRDTYVKENYAGEKELHNELVETNSYLNEISAKLSVLGEQLVSNGF